MKPSAAAGILLLALASVFCGGSGSTPTPVPTPTPTPPNPSARFPVLVAAGDIACDPQTPELPCRDRETARLARDILAQHETGFLLPLGDLQYTSGTLAQFNSMYDRAWGQLASRSRPIPGNHEHLTARATGYFDFFSTRNVDVGTRAQGWYQWAPAPTWAAYAINSDCADVGGCNVGSPQERFLITALAANQSRACQIAYMHHPLFSSGENGNTPDVRPIWQALYAAGVDIILSGHDHLYERFNPQSPTGVADPRGPRLFVVGTGGRDLYKFIDSKPNSAFKFNQNFGVLKLVLKESSYDWAFVTIDGTVIDPGSANCL